MMKHIEIGISGEMLKINSFGLIQTMANDLSIGGAIFTKKDGSIKIIAEGEEILLVQFADKIKNEDVFGENTSFYVNLSDVESVGNFYIISTE